MSTINPAIYRNIARVLGGALASWGLVSASSVEQVTNPAVWEALVTTAGVLCVVGAEVSYGMAKRFGWRT